jgi:hypothetical protein
MHWKCYLMIAPQSQIWYQMVESKIRLLKRVIGTKFVILAYVFVEVILFQNFINNNLMTFGFRERFMAYFRAIVM